MAVLFACPVHGLSSSKPCKRCRRNTASRPGLNRSRWQRMRAMVRRRDGVCQGCGARDGLSVHHKRKARHGGSDAMDNLVLLCSSCHGRAEVGGVV